MSKKNDNFYFENFIECADISCAAATFLRSTLLDFDPAEIDVKRQKLHELEHRGDNIKHELTAELARAFITPIERDDIIALINILDNVTDSIEDILIQIYINNVNSIRNDSIKFADIIISCCETMKRMLTEFRYFKKSKELGNLIIELNHLEEKGDVLYVECMRKLHSDPADPMTVIAWREIYNCFEKCCDNCEDVADIVEEIAIDNI